VALYDAIVAGAGHNGLVAATLLARTGRRVLVLERSPAPGGATVSAAPFAGVDARVSRYSYLVSLFPRALLAELGISLELRRRRVSSYTPVGDGGVLIGTGAADPLAGFGALTARFAAPVFRSLTEPLRSREQFRGLVGDDDAWRAFFERPLADILESELDDDVIRGIAATDALIGTFADLRDPGLLANRCFLYHVVGGPWDVPVGGMGALSGALARAAQEAGAELRTSEPVVAVQSDGHRVSAHTAGDRTDTGRAQGHTAADRTYTGRHLLCGAAPAELARLLDDPPPPGPPPEGSQLKLNMLLRRLPRLRDPAVSPEDAFAGTFHVNESYTQLQDAFAQAAAGSAPALPPCEAYCHSLADPSILGADLRAAGVQTLTVFGLHMPARVFSGDHDAAKQTAVRATLDSINSVLAEPLEDCLLRAPNGSLCLEARTPVELEHELGMPGGHIFHRDLTWPFAESETDVGRWGVETERPNVWICGAGARRGGAVSGIPGHNAARAVIEADAR
jgi:phytoene dehydrogenase-like protein